ncbi:GAF domain-containing protein [Jatrophihabitans fulvus]
MTDPLLDQLATTAAALAPVITPDGHAELLRSLTETARALFGAGACSLALLSEDEEELVYVAASGAGADAVIDMRIGATQGIAGWVMQSGQAAAVSDLRHDARFASDVAEETGYVPQAILAVPVTGRTGQLGVLTLLDRDATRDGAQFDLRTAALFADQAALAIESSRAAADVGRLLLTALADAAGEGTELAAALASRTPRRADADLHSVATLLATLASRSPADARLASRVLQTFLDAR